MAASSQLKVAKAEASQRISNARKAARTKGYEHAIVAQAAGITTAALFGTLNRYKIPVTIGGFPWKLGLSALAMLGQAMTKGNVQAAMQGVSIATTAVYVERSISTDTLVAGGEVENGENGGNV